MELTNHGPDLSLSEEEMKEIRLIWEKRSNLIDQSASFLLESFRNRRVSKDSEINTWLEFIEFPPNLVAPIANKATNQAWAIMSNQIPKVFNVVDEDFLTTHRLTQILFDFTARKQDDEIVQYSEVKGYIISQAIIQHLNSLAPLRKSKGKLTGQLSHLHKTRLLHELGFFELLKEKNIKSYTDMGMILSILFDSSDVDSLRRIASNSAQHNKNQDKDEDIFKDGIEEDLIRLLNERIPKAKLFKNGVK